jgi:hypothetical protein
VKNGEIEASPRKSPLEKLLEKPNSRAQAVESFCYQCFGAIPGWRGAVKECSSYQCSLYLFRPGASGTEEELVKWTEKTTAYCESLKQPEESENEPV